MVNTELIVISSSTGDALPACIPVHGYRYTHEIVAAMDFKQQWPYSVTRE